MIGEDYLEKKSKNYALIVSILLWGVSIWFMADTIASKVQLDKEDITSQKVLCYLASLSVKKEVKQKPVEKSLPVEKPKSLPEKKQKIIPPQPEPPKNVKKVKQEVTFKELSAKKITKTKETPKPIKKEVKQKPVEKSLPVEKPKSLPEKKQKIKSPQPEPSKNIEEVKQKPPSKELNSEKITKPQQPPKLIKKEVKQESEIAYLNKANFQDNQKAIRETLLAKILALIEKEKFYPPLAKRLGLEGKVTLQIVVDRNGRISKIEILETKGHSLFKKGALKTMERVTKHSLGVKLSEPLTLKISIQYLLKDS